MKTNNKKAPKSLHNFVDVVANSLSEFVSFLFKKTVFASLWVSKKILKRYLHIELPLYRLWWQQHSEYMQREIYKQHPEWQISKHA